MTDEKSDYQATREPGFWQTIYDSEEPRWDLGGHSRVLAAALDLGLLGAPGRVFVPGCGRGHDALLLAERGFDVVAVDFADTAISHVRSEATRRGLAIDARQADIFSIQSEPAGSFDALFEYTCFCAIDPALRPGYCDLVSHLVRPGGRMAFLAFPVEERPSGPPHGLDLDAIRELFAPRWRWVLHSQSPLSPAPRQGREFFVLLERTEVPA